MAVVDAAVERARLSPDISEQLGRANVEWLAPLREQLAAMQVHGRLPHALLLLGQHGAGQSELALWLAARLSCDKASACGDCAGCRLFLAGTHPDFRFIGIEADAKAIRVEQIRDLSEALSLKGYRGRNKVVVIDPAEAMNINSFNALLKTLEEPADNTFLVLCTSRADRLPRTIVSRAARLRVPLPARGDALVWLDRQEERAGWERLLALANGAPFLALRYAHAGLENLDEQMQSAVDAAAQGRLDVVAAAKAWAADQPEARLFWLESWLTDRLQEASLSSDLVNNNRLPWLRAAGRASMIRTGYRLLDALREARVLVGGALNTQLLFEGLLVSLAAFAGGGAESAQESMD